MGILIYKPPGYIIECVAKNKILEILKKFKEFLCACGLAKIHTPVFNVGMEYPYGLFQSDFRIANV